MAGTGLACLTSRTLHCLASSGTDSIEHPMNCVSGQCCDHPHHPAHHVHAHDYHTMTLTKPGEAVLGNATGKLYKLR